MTTIFMIFLSVSVRSTEYEQDSSAKARKLGAELIHRDEEIRHEREKTAEAEASKRALDQQLRDCCSKIDEAEAYARAEGKRTAAKYEGR
ncbi:unnamed protein product, partial [Rotaria magnacalcarata]